MAFSTALSFLGSRYFVTLALGHIGVCVIFYGAVVFGSQIILSCWLYTILGSVSFPTPLSFCGSGMCSHFGFRSFWGVCHFAQRCRFPVSEYFVFLAFGFKGVCVILYKAVAFGFRNSSSFWL